MNTPQLKEQPMPISYTTKDICKMFYIGRVKCLELFHRAGFPAQKYVRGFGIEANALANTTMHFDETSTHLHIVGVPVFYDCKRVK